MSFAHTAGTSNCCCFRLISKRRAWAVVRRRVWISESHPVFKMFGQTAARKLKRRRWKLKTLILNLGRLGVATPAVGKHTGFPKRVWLSVPSSACESWRVPLFFVDVCFLRLAQVFRIGVRWCPVACPASEGLPRCLFGFRVWPPVYC